MRLQTPAISAGVNRVMTDDSPKTTSAGLVAKIKLVLAKRQANRAFEEFQRDYGNQSEYRTRTLYAESVLVPVDKIVDDPKFTNIRLTVDSSKIADLQTSVDLEGLRTPVTVIEAASPGYYHVRAGFRRLQVVRNLGWAQVPAIVLPADTPESEEYWANILEEHQPREALRLRGWPGRQAHARQIWRLGGELRQEVRPLPRVRAPAPLVRRPTPTRSPALVAQG